MKLKNHGEQIVVFVISLLVQAVLLMVGHAWPAQNLVPITACSWILSFYVISLKREEQLVDSVNTKLEENLKRFDRSALRTFQDSSAALNYLAGCMPSATAVWSTGIPTKRADNCDASTVPDLDSYTESIKKALGRHLTLEEIVTAELEPRTQEYKRSCRTGKSIYHCTIIDRPETPFINFSILEYKADEREVVFGWVITEIGRFQGKCFASKDPNLIELFRSIHTVLLTGGKRITASQI